MKGDKNRDRNVSKQPKYCCKIVQSQINYITVVSKTKIKDRITPGQVN